MSGVSRRGLMLGAGVLGAGGALPALAVEAGLEVVDLRAQTLVEPLGVEGQAVRLSWKLKSADRGALQTRYEVEAASSQALLQAGQADLWRAGEVLTDQSFDIAYLGRPLKARETVYWRVTVKDNKGRKAVSATASWEMGLLDPADWKAQWLAAETPLAKADREAGLLWMRGDRPADQSPRYFRLRIDLPRAASITLFSIANAPYALFVDGEPAPRPAYGPHAFGVDPISATEHRLAAGPHVIAVRVDDPSGFNQLKLHEIATALMVRARFADGAERRITSKGMKTALHAPQAWQGVGFDDKRWGAAQVSENQVQAWPQCGAFLLRKDFSAPKAVASARLYATALGAYEAYINGQRVGDALLTPESSDFRETALYRAYDVTKLLRQGDNAIGAMVADGWYGSYHAPAGRFAFGPPPLRFLGQLEITYADGERAVLATDDSWKIAPAPVTRSEIYYGEDYDARREQPGWANAGFAAPGWRPAEIGAAPPCRLKAQISPPIRRVKTLSAVSIQEPSPGVFVFDFGQNFAGWARLRATGKAGQSVTLKFAEVLKADGRVDQSNLRAARAAAVYTLKGDPAGEIYEPRFSYFGFRYVEVLGLTAKPTRDDVLGVAISSDLEQTGHLRIANPLIQQLWQNALWSQRSNFMGVPTDCPQRDERLGWTGDAQVFWDAAAFNMDVAAFTERFAGDLRDGQGPRGEYPDYAPAGWRDLAVGASPGWADAGVLLPWTAWRRYGDTAIVDQNWAAMTRYLRFIADHNPDLIWRNLRGYDFGDWVALDAKQPGDETTPKALIATAFWKHSVDAMADMAAGSGRKPEAARYVALSKEIAAAFQTAFVRADGGIGNESQAGYILALRFGLVPTALRAAAAQRLVADIRRRGTLLSTGFLGTPYSLDVLADTGHDDVVYDLLLRTEFPSWGYMVKKGATTIWERWNGDTGDVAMNSFNHYALGAVTGFVFRRIAGFEPTSAAFKTFEFDPALDPRVPRGGGDYDSVLGRLSTDWEIKPGGGFTLDITIPTNGRAKVRLPARAAEAVREGGMPLAQAAGVHVIGLEGDRLALDVGSGRYRFEVRG